MYNVKCVQGFLNDASLHEGEQGLLFVDTLTCLDDRLGYCKTKILLRSKFSPAQRLHRRNTLKLVKPLRLPPVFQVQGSDLLCLVYMMNNLLQMDGVIDQTSLDLIARAMAIEQMKNMGENSDALLLNLVNSYKQVNGNFNYTVAHRAFNSLGYSTEHFESTQLDLVHIFLKDVHFKGFTVHTGGENSGHFYALVCASERM